MTFPRLRTRSSRSSVRASIRKWRLPPREPARNIGVVPRPRLLLPLAIFLLGAVAPAHAATIVRSEGGPDAATIKDTVDAFRADLGARREITWENVPAAQEDPNPLPGNFYVPRGVLLSTPGTSLRVSGNGFNSKFTPFSPPALFSPFGSTTTVVDFQVPGSSTAALSRGFGAVF